MAIRPEPGGELYIEGQPGKIDPRQEWSFLLVADIDMNTPESFKTTYRIRAPGISNKRFEAGDGDVVKWRVTGTGLFDGTMRLETDEKVGPGWEQIDFASPNIFVDRSDTGKLPSNGSYSMVEVSSDTTAEEGSSGSSSGSGPDPVAEFNVEELKVAKNAVPGNNSEASITLRNIGNATGGIVVSVSVNGKRVTETEFSDVRQGETQTKKVSYTTPGSEYTLNLPRFNASTNVEPRQPEPEPTPEPEPEPTPEPEPEPTPEPEPSPSPEPDESPPQGTLVPDIEAPNSAMVGESFTIGAVVDAAGGRVEATKDIGLKLDGRTVLSDTVGPLPVGGQYKRTVSVQAQEAGQASLTLSVGGKEESDSINIEPEPTAEFEVSSLDVVESALPGGSSEVKVAVNNIGDAAGSITVPVLVDGVKASSVRFSNVRPGGSASSRATYTTPDADSYTLELGEFGLSTNVSPPEPQQPGDDSEIGIPEPPNTRPSPGGGQGGGIIGGVSDRKLAIGAGVAAGAVLLSRLGGD